MTGRAGSARGRHCVPGCSGGWRKRYSIALPTRTAIDSGNFWPSALAVCRLSTSSYRLGCSIGRSAGRQVGRFGAAKNPGGVTADAAVRPTLAEAAGDRGAAVGEHRPAGGQRQAPFQRPCSKALAIRNRHPIGQRHQGVRVRTRCLGQCLLHVRRAVYGHVDHFLVPNRPARPCANTGIGGRSVGLVRLSACLRGRRANSGLPPCVACCAHRAAAERRAGSWVRAARQRVFVNVASHCAAGPRFPPWQAFRL